MESCIMICCPNNPNGAMIWTVVSVIDVINFVAGISYTAHEYNILYQMTIKRLWAVVVFEVFSHLLYDNYKDGTENFRMIEINLELVLDMAYSITYHG